MLLSFNHILLCHTLEEEPFIIYESFKNFIVPSTFAVYTYVYARYMYQNDEIMDMEKSYCVLPRYSEEKDREREDGYFQLQVPTPIHLI
jgi:hypothetical protein